MSWNPALDPHCPTGNEVDAIETIIVPRARDIGGFEVRRALPSTRRQMVGPFIFFDQAGPAEFLAGQGIDVRPHPHVGLATVTYLFQGAIHHLDSLGNSMEITPGSVNLMPRPTQCAFAGTRRRSATQPGATRTGETPDVLRRAFSPRSPRERSCVRPPR